MEARVKRTRITPEKVAEIKRLWNELRVCAHVARATGVCEQTAMRLKPAFIPVRPKATLTAETRERIRQAWHRLDTAQQVADEVGVCRDTAMQFMPDEYRNANQTGYKTWSEETRARWDRYWNNPHATERMEIVRGWNEP